MSGYSDEYKDRKHADFLARWVSQEETDRLGISDQSRFWLARARAAETALDELKTALATVRRNLCP